MESWLDDLLFTVRGNLSGQVMWGQFSWFVLVWGSVRLTGTVDRRLEVGRVGGGADIIYWTGRWGGVPRHINVWWPEEWSVLVVHLPQSNCGGAGRRTVSFYSKHHLFLGQISEPGSSYKVSNMSRWFSFIIFWFFTWYCIRKMFDKLSRFLDLLLLYTSPMLEHNCY